MTEDDVTRAGALLRSYRAAWDLFQITNGSNSVAVKPSIFEKKYQPYP